LDALQSYYCSGNVRELENVIERAEIVSTGKKLVLGEWLSTTEAPPEKSEIPTLEELEKKHIPEVLEMTDWRVSGEKGAAKILG
jgi:formate hydrogenlyase transcriptional activator